MILLTVYLLFSNLNGLTEANSTHLPRMVFTDKDTAMKKLPLPGQHIPVQIVLPGEPGTVTTAGQKHLISFNFQNPKTLVEGVVLKKECSGSGSLQEECNYNITVVHETEEANQLFVCGTSLMSTKCCHMNLSQPSPTCTSPAKMQYLEESVKNFIIKEGEPSALAESAGSADLYITYSGSQQYVGIHKFGKHRVGPPNQNKEQYYVGLMLSTQKGHPSQDKVYAFYKEKNSDTSLYSEMWLPFVTQVCMADMGGPKNTLQFTWTSQLNARLFCGDSETKQHFSELVDVATVRADRWQDTRVYALFRNEWGMSAVCVYTIEDIDHLFKTSSFKGDVGNRDRACVPDSTKIHLDRLKMIEKTTEMKDWVHPVNKSGPLLLNHHKYTHIYVDSFQHKRNNDHTVLFLSLHNGGIHKVMKNESQSFLIAEYQPFPVHTHITSIILHPSSRKLYVSSGSEMVQLDVANCAQYGDSCEQCVLARDPYCSWNGTHCTAETHGTLVQDVTQGNHNICTSRSEVVPNGKVSRYSTDTHAEEDVDSIRLPHNSRYFLKCSVSSRHAKYTWHHPQNSTSCSTREQQCLFLIDSMGPEQVGTYKCVSEEKGYIRVLAQYKLKMKNSAAGHSSSPLLLVCLMAVLIKSLSC